jgi:hypothetical protein
MPAISIPICRSLLAGDKERPLSDQPWNRLQAGSYNPNKPKPGIDQELGRMDLGHHAHRK